MGFDFTIAVLPELASIDKELQYIKSALLYADQIFLISPISYMFTQLSSQARTFDEKEVIRLLKYFLPLYKDQDPWTYQNGMAMVNKLSLIMFSRQYKAFPTIKKLEFRNQLKSLMQQLDAKCAELLGECQIRELNALLTSGKVELKKFEHSLSDVNGTFSEFFIQLTKSIKSSFPLFDETSNHLMRSAVEARVINLNESEKRKIIHAGVSDNLIQRLPSFDSASVDEILDIRKELSDPLIRFRSKVQSYSESIQTVPWNDDFENECSLLYNQEVAPAILEIDELTKEASFVKNLVGKVTSDGDFRKVAGELIIGIAAAGVIPSFTQIVSQDVAALTAGGLWATSKIAEAYKEYREKKREISKKDLYFYYRVGKMLSR